VYVQADTQFRSTSKRYPAILLRSDAGMMIPLDNLVIVEQTANPQVIRHYNLFRSAEITALPPRGGAPGRYRRDGSAGKERTAEWNGPSNGAGCRWKKSSPVGKR